MKSVTYYVKVWATKEPLLTAEAAKYLKLSRPEFYGAVKVMNIHPISHRKSSHGSPHNLYEYSIIRLLWKFHKACVACKGDPVRLHKLWLGDEQEKRE